MKKLQTILLLVLFSLLVTSCTDNYWDTNRYKELNASLQDLVDSTLTDYLQKVPNYPGGIALKVIQGKDAFFVSAGMGDSMTGDTRFRAASCTKTFTATAILKLYQEGKLNINALVTDTIPGSDKPYLPATPDYAIPHKDKITILALLKHRAGVYDVANEIIPDTIPADVPYKGLNYISYQTDANPDHQFTFDELAGVVAETGLFYFVPGTAYHYSNTGYTLLGEVIERVSGQSYQDYLTNEVLLPMGLSGSSLPALATDQNIPEPYVRGYVLYDNEIYDRSAINVSMFVSEGNLITTANDMSLFINKLLNGKGVLSNHTVNGLMMNYQSTGGIAAGGYGCGLSYTNNLGYGHTGAVEGYLSLMAYDPILDFTVVAFTNGWNLNDGMAGLEYQVINVLEAISYESKTLFNGVQ